MIAVAAETATMRAVVCHRPTKPAELHVKDVARPAVADNGVLVRVRGSSANPVDLFHVSPVAYVMRGFKPTGVGTDLAGVVEEVGAGVTRFRAGDEVFGAARGAFAEYATVSEGAGIVPKPAGVSFADAGTLAVAGSTALQALRDHGQIRPGHRVLVNGASGGVGTFTVQIARALGGDVTAVCSTRNLEMVRSIGAGTVIDYSKEDFTRRGDRYDLIVDVAGSHPLSACVRLLNAGGTFVCVGAAAIQHNTGGTFRALARLARVRIASSSRVKIFIAKISHDDLSFLGELVASGRVKPVIEKTYDLADAGRALAGINEGHLQGKLAVAIGG